MTWKPIKGALTAPIDTNCAPSLNRLAREQMKLKLMQDIRTDLIICEIEGWDKREYLNELKELINSFG